MKLLFSLFFFGLFSSMAYAASEMDPLNISIKNHQKFMCSAKVPMNKNSKIILEVTLQMYRDGSMNFSYIMDATGVNGYTMRFPKEEFALSTQYLSTLNNTHSFQLSHGHSMIGSMDVGFLNVDFSTKTAAMSLPQSKSDGLHQLAFKKCRFKRLRR